MTDKLPGVVAATIELYNTIRAELLPTPAKSHYCYNMRDLSKLFQVGLQLRWQQHIGFFLGRSTACAAAKNIYTLSTTIVHFMLLNTQGMQSVGVPLQDSSSLVRLWAHEAMRVFHDRLVDDGDRGWFCGLVARMLPKHFGVAVEEVFSEGAQDAPLSPASPSRPLPADPSAMQDAAQLQEQKSAAAALRNVLFADFLQPGVSAEAAKYQEACDVGKLLKRVEESLADYNEQVCFKTNVSAQSLC